MQAEEVVNLYKLFQENGIEVWIDGGWGIDALLGEQTRPHKDLDIAINHKDVEKLRSLLTNLGYKDKEKEGSTDWNFVLENHSNEIDVHVFEFDENGKNIYGIEYPKESLSGTGVINGQTVNCIPPEWVVKFHTQAKYEPKEKDIKDANAICDKFSLEPSENYKIKKMSDLVIGKGKLAGKGVYANRDFKKGEIVTKYNLELLTKEEYKKLPGNEKKFTHTHWGQIYLYLEPDRYVNHSKTPNTQQDLANKCDIAAIDIKKGEMITTDATKDDI